MSAGPDARRALRSLLSALIERTDGAQGLYIPKGEDGMIRMIAALLDMGAGEDADAALAARIAWFSSAFRPENHA